MRCAVLAIVIALAPNARAECVTESADAAALVSAGDAAMTTNLDEAISKYEMAIAAASSSPRVASKLAAAYEKKESWEKAIATLEKACALDPTNASFARRLGRARVQGASRGLATYVDAQAAFAAAVRLDPRWGEAHFDLADVMWRLDDEHGALEHFTEAVKLAPSVAAHWAALADIYRRLRFFSEASKVIAEAARFVKTDDFELGRVAGRVHEHAGETDAAIASYESAKRACGVCNGGQAIVDFDLARVYIRAKRTTEAENARQSFFKRICKGGAAARYADECTQANAWRAP